MRRGIFAICRLDFRLLKRDPAVLVVLVLMPLLIMVVMKPMFRLVFLSEGRRNVSGAQQAVPGLAVTFSFFLITFVGYSIFREHSWNTWQKLRCSPIRAIDVIVGKSIPGVVVGLSQQTLLIVVGGLLLGLHVNGELVALPVVSLALSVCLVSRGLALASVCRTVQQVGTFGNLSTILLGVLSGGLVPLFALPGWAQRIAPATPGYWALKGYQAVILDGGGLGAVARPAVILLLFGGAFAMITARRFRYEEAKIGWS